MLSAVEMIASLSMHKNISDHFLSSLNYRFYCIFISTKCSDVLKIKKFLAPYQILINLYKWGWGQGVGYLLKGVVPLLKIFMYSLYKKTLCLSFPVISSIILWSSSVFKALKTVGRESPVASLMRVVFVIGCF